MSILNREIIIFALLLCLCACNQTSDIDKLLDSYVEGLQQFDFNIIDSCMATKYEEMSNDFSGPIYAYVIEQCNDIRLEGKEITINGDKAVATVIFSFPDVSSAITSAIQKYLHCITISGKPASTNEGNILFSECLMQVNTDADIETIAGEIYFEKVGSEWRITDISNELVAVIGCNYLEAFKNTLGGYDE